MFIVEITTGNIVDEGDALHDAYADPILFTIVSTPLPVGMYLPVWNNITASWQESLPAADIAATQQAAIFNATPAAQAAAEPLLAGDIGVKVKPATIEIVEWSQSYAIATLAALPVVPISTFVVKEGAPSLTLVGADVTSQEEAVYAVDCYLEVLNTSVALRSRDTAVMIQASIIVDGIVQGVIKCPVRFASRATVPNAVSSASRRLAVRLPMGATMSASCVILQDEPAAMAQPTTSATLTIQLTEL